MTCIHPPRRRTHNPPPPLLSNGLLQCDPVQRCPGPTQTHASSFPRVKRFFAICTTKPDSKLNPGAISAPRSRTSDHFNVSCFSPFSPGTWAVLFGLVVVLWGSYHKFPLLHDGAVRLGHAACHLSIGVVCFGVFCAVVWARDRLFLVNLKRLWKSENID